MSAIKLWFVTVVYIWSISSEAFKITPVHIGDRTRLKSKTEKATGKLVCAIALFPLERQGPSGRTGGIEVLPNCRDYLWSNNTVFV